MIVAFYINEMNFRGVANSTYQYSLFNKTILKNKSIIFYNKKNSSNRKEVIEKFKKKFKVLAVSNFNEIDKFKEEYSIDFLYTQKGGEKDDWNSKKIKTIVHSIYPQKLNQVHGDNYAYISEWISKDFSNYKIPYVPYIVDQVKNSKNLKKKFKIKKNQTVFGCHGGESSFDLKFVHDVLKKIVEIRKDITFIFLNINKFCSHPRIIFIKGTSDDSFKKNFINTCDAMIYGRSLGESFGLACAEFVINNKTIISYRFNRHRAHEFHNKKEFFIEYGSYKELKKILLDFNKDRKIVIKTKYKTYKPKMVMNIFRKVFLKSNDRIQLTFEDYLVNFQSYMKMNYLYLRHKLYNHYYKYLESKMFNFKD